jgi:hypothetical protein
MAGHAQSSADTSNCPNEGDRLIAQVRSTSDLPAAARSAVSVRRVALVVGRRRCLGMLGMCAGTGRLGSDATIEICNTHDRAIPEKVQPLDADAYRRTYQREMLDRLDPHQAAAQLRALAGGAAPVLCCWDRAGSGASCHRAQAPAWLSTAIGAPVPEVGFETLP